MIRTKSVPQINDEIESMKRVQAKYLKENKYIQAEETKRAIGILYKQRQEAINRKPMESWDGITDEDRNEIARRVVKVCLFADILNASVYELDEMTGKYNCQVDFIDNVKFATKNLNKVVATIDHMRSSKLSEDFFNLSNNFDEKIKYMINNEASRLVAEAVARDE